MGVNWEFFFTEAIPFFMEEVEEYISLVPMISPLTPLSTKYGWPAFDVRRSKWASSGAFARTEAILFSAPCFCV
jgi:hypothetical protein